MTLNSRIDDLKKKSINLVFIWKMIWLFMAPMFNKKKLLEATLETVKTRHLIGNINFSSIEVIILGFNKSSRLSYYYYDESKKPIRSSLNLIYMRPKRQFL